MDDARATHGGVLDALVEQLAMTSLVVGLSAVLLIVSYLLGYRRGKQVCRGDPWG